MISQRLTSDIKKVYDSQLLNFVKPGLQIKQKHFGQSYSSEMILICYFNSCEVIRVKMPLFLFCFNSDGTLSNKAL